MNLSVVPLSLVQSFKQWIGAVSDQKSVTLTDPFALQMFALSPTVSGMTIDAATAMRVPAVRAAAVLISEMIGVIPFKLYQRQGDGKEAAPDHTAYKLIHDEPNEDQGAEEFRALLTLDAILTDNGYAYVNRVEGRAVELLRLDPLKITPKQSPAGETVYEYQSGTDRRIFTRDEILRIKAPGGCSPIKHAREAIALSIILEQHAARLFSKGARPSGVLEFPNNLPADAVDAMRTAWNADHGGENSGRTAILWGGGKFNQAAMSSVDSQFLEMRRLQVVEIARAFNVPPTMLMDLERGTWSNVEQLDLYFRTYTLTPWLAAWSRAYGRALLSPSERGQFFVEAVQDAIVAADTAARSDAIAKQISSRVITPNEARAMLNLPAHPQGNDLVNPYTTTGAAPAVAQEQAA